MSTDDDATVPIATGRHHGDQPTAPIRRPAPDRTADRAHADEDSGEPGTGSGTAARSAPVTSGSTAQPAPEGRTPRAPLRVGTVVWGLVLAIIGAGIVAIGAGARVDVELAFIVLLTLAGLGLVGGSVAAGVRGRH